MTSRRLVIPATGSEAVAAVRAHHVEVSTAVGTHVARAATHAEALVELDRVALDTAGALQAQGFATVAEAEAARIPDAELDPVRRMLRAAQDQRAAALATLADPEIVAASHLAEPDLEALTAAASTARAALLQAREEQAMAERTDRDLRRLREGICHRVAELGTALSSHECVARLADTVAGLSADKPSGCASPRSSSPPAWSGWPRSPTSGWRSWATAGTASSTPTAWPAGAGAAGSGCSSGTCGPVRRGTPPRSPAASRSWRRWPWRSGSLTPCGRSPGIRPADPLHRRGLRQP